MQIKQALKSTTNFEKLIIIKDEKMKDYYTYFGCSDGSCPMIVEREMYGVVTATCEDYCGTGFGGCSTCTFECSDICSECVHRIQSEAELRGRENGR